MGSLSKMGHTIHVRVHREIVELLDAIASARGQSRSSFVRETILLRLAPILSEEQRRRLIPRARVESTTV